MCNNFCAVLPSNIKTRSRFFPALLFKKWIQKGLGPGESLVLDSGIRQSCNFNAHVMFFILVRLTKCVFYKTAGKLNFIRGGYTGRIQDFGKAPLAMSLYYLNL